MTNYESYIQSDAWKYKRLLKMKWDGVWFATNLQCERCGWFVPQNRIEIHHNTYERLGSEELSDLNILCRECHAQEHGVSSGDQRHISAIMERVVKRADRNMNRPRPVPAIPDDFEVFNDGDF